MSAAWWVLGALVTAVLAFAAREMLIGGTGWLARRIIIRAARRLPEGRRELRCEEWLAEYDVFAAKGLHIRGLIYACGTHIGAVRMAPSRQGAVPLKRAVSAFRGYVPTTLIGRFRIASAAMVLAIVSMVVALVVPNAGVRVMAITTGATLFTFAATFILHILKEEKPQL
jgi:hypothetical protein